VIKTNLPDSNTKPDMDDVVHLPLVFLSLETGGTDICMIYVYL
jgi:hypothetical protein